MQQTLPAISRTTHALGARLRPLLRGWRWEVIASALVLFILAYSWMFSAITVPNERSRLYLTIALVEHDTIRIDAPMEAFGPVYDQASRDGHWYTDKAPGASLLAVGPYLLGRALNPEVWPLEARINFLRTWLMLPIGLLGFLLARALLRLRAHPQAVVEMVSFSWILGSAAFHYSTAFFGHQIVAVSLLGALYLVLRVEQRLAPAAAPTPDAARAPDAPSQATDAAPATSNPPPQATDAAPATSDPPPRATTPDAPRRRARWPQLAAMLGAGLLAGLAGLTEYQAAIPCVALFGLLIAGPLRRRPALLAVFVLGALPFALALFAYNKAAFGGYLELSYDYLVNPALRELHGKGVGGVSTPDLAFAEGGLISLHRGLFTTAPLFLLALPGLLALWRASRRLAITCGLVIAYFLLFISSTEVWPAGWGFGPRLLAPMLPWALLPIACAIDRMRPTLIGDGLARGLALTGVAYFQVVHVVFPELPDKAINPLIDAVVPALEAERLSPNLGSAYLGLTGLNSLRPLLVALTLVAVVVLWRGVSKSWKTWGERSAVIVCAAAAAVPLLLMILFGDRGWSDRDRAWFLGWLEELAVAEQRLRDDP